MNYPFKKSVQSYIISVKNDINSTIFPTKIPKKIILVKEKAYEQCKRTNDNSDNSLQLYIGQFSKPAKLFFYIILAGLPKYQNLIVPLLFLLSLILLVKEKRQDVSQHPASKIYQKVQRYVFTICYILVMSPTSDSRRNFTMLRISLPSGICCSIW